VYGGLGDEVEDVAELGGAPVRVRAEAGPAGQRQAVDAAEPAAAAASGDGYRQRGGCGDDGRGA
jgi:hypothetical protein